MPWYYTASQELAVQAVLLAGLHGTEASTTQIFPYVGGVDGNFQTMGINSLIDPDSIIVNPASTNPTTTPQIIINRETYFSASWVTFQITEYARGAIAAPFVINFGIFSLGSWRKVGSIDIDAAALAVNKVRAVSVQVPWFAAMSQQMEFSLAIASDAGTPIINGYEQRIFLSSYPTNPVHP